MASDFFEYNFKIIGKGAERFAIPDLGILRFENGSYKGFQIYPDVEIKILDHGDTWFMQSIDALCKFRIKMANNIEYRINVYKEEVPDTRENKFQHHVIDRLNREFPGCYVLKTDPGYIQGFPDLLVLYNDTWAALEIKKDRTAHHQPNQDNYIYNLNDMAYAAFLFPENVEEVFNDLQRAFRLRG